MSPFRFGVGGSQLAADLGQWTANARRIEGMGYSVLSIGDHPSMPGVGPLSAMAAAASATTTLRVGTYVLANDFRHPAQLAREIATIDQLSNGRVELGLGAGWLEDDYATYGLPFDRPSVRVTRLDEALEIVGRCFAGERFSFAGAHYQIEALEGFPRPQQVPRPPIVVGGGSPAVLAVAARRADVVVITDSFRRGGEQLREPTLQTSTWEATLRKISAIERAAGDRFADLELGVLVQQVIVTDDVEHAAAAAAARVHATPEEVLASPNYLIGDTARIVDRLEELRQATGVSYVTVVSRDAEAFAPVVATLAGRA
jgi:probable F420-dependent oxidoreductase